MGATPWPVSCHFYSFGLVISTSLLWVLLLDILYGGYRKRPRLDGDDEEAEGVVVKTEPLIPGLDLVVDAANADFDIKDEDVSDPGAANSSLWSTLHRVMSETVRIFGVFLSQLL